MISEFFSLRATQNTCARIVKFGSTSWKAATVNYAMNHNKTRRNGFNDLRFDHRYHARAAAPSRFFLTWKRQQLKAIGDFITEQWNLFQT